MLAAAIRAINQLRGTFRLAGRTGYMLGHARPRSGPQGRQHHRQIEATGRWHALHEQCSAPCMGPSHDE